MKVRTLLGQVEPNTDISLFWVKNRNCRKYWPASRKRSSQHWPTIDLILNRLHLMRSRRPSFPTRSTIPCSFQPMGRVKISDWVPWCSPIFYQPLCTFRADISFFWKSGDSKISLKFLQYEHLLEILMAWKTKLCNNNTLTICFLWFNSVFC